LVTSVAGRTGAFTLTTADVGGLGTIATQAANNVSITGGSITGITDLAVADGGTGASNASDARTNLGLVIGTDVLSPTGSAASLTSFPTFNQNTTGSAATLTTGRTIAVTGDLAYTSPSFDGSTNVTAAGTLATVNANVGSFTAANITVNAKGLITAASNGTAGATISNDTSTASNLFPLFASATSGTPTTIYTSDAKYLYKPSTGELQASTLVASNGIVVNSQTVSASYTIAVGFSAMSSGPVTVASGQSVTVSSGSRWVVI
jgi:hypothetical protein